MSGKWILFTVGLLVLFAVLWSACKRKEPEMSDPNLAKQKLDELEPKLKVTFPHSARLLHYKHIRGMDDSIFLKVEINRDDLQMFIKSSPFAGKHLRTDRRYGTPNSIKFPWWNPESPYKYKSGQIRLPNAEALNILMDLDRSEKVVIYLLWHQT